jgi:hypothetical protein
MQGRPLEGTVYSQPFDGCDHVAVIADETIAGCSSVSAQRHHRSRA